MTLGADRKKIVWLTGVLVAGGALIYWADFSSPDSAPVAVPVSSVPVAAPPAGGRPAAKPAERRRVTSQNLSDNWKPRLGPKNPEDRPDPATIDPTVHLDLLARVQAVEPAAAGRNLFVFGAAPPPPAPAGPLPVVGKIAINHPSAAPPQIVNPGPPPNPVAPPMNFKYYGYKVSKTDGHKAAFLLDGDDILIAGENDTVKNRRYRVVKIGVNSITIEDTQFKSTQTLPLTESPSA